MEKPAQNKNPKRKNRWLRRLGRVLLGFLILLLILSGLLYYIVNHRQDEIKREAEELLTKGIFHADSVAFSNLQLETRFFLSPTFIIKDLKVWGQDSRSLAPSFDFERVQVDIKLRHYLGTLLSAMHFDFSKFKFALEGGEIEPVVERILAENGAIRLVEFEDIENYKLFRPSLSRVEELLVKDKRPSEVVINNLEFNELKLEYTLYADSLGNKSASDFSLDEFHSIAFQSLRMGLFVNKEHVKFQNLYASGAVDSLTAGTKQALKAKPFALSGALELLKPTLKEMKIGEHATKLIADSLHIKFPDLSFAAKGFFTKKRDTTNFSFEIHTDIDATDNTKSSITSLLALIMPPKVFDQIAKFDPEGSIQLSGKIEKNASPVNIKLHYELEDASFEFAVKEGGVRRRISNLMAQGDFFNGSSNEPSYLTTDIYGAELYEGQHFNAQLRIDNVLKTASQENQGAFLNVSFSSSQIDVKKLMQFLEYEDLNARGSLTFDKVSFSGPTSAIDFNYDLMQYDGKISFDDVRVSLPEDFPFLFQVDSLTGSIVFDDKVVHPKLQGRFNNYSFSIQNGYLDGLIAQLLSKEKGKLSINDVELRLSGVKAKQLFADIDSWNRHPTKQPVKKTLIESLNALKALSRMKNVTMHIKDFDVSGLYVSDSSQSPDSYILPESMVFDSLQLTLSVDDNITIDKLALKNENEQLVISPIVFSSITPSSFNFSTSIGFQSVDIADLACQLGKNFNLGVHKGVSLKLRLHTNLQGKVTKENTFFQAALDYGSLKNAEYGINIDSLNFSMNGYADSKGKLVLPLNIPKIHVKLDEDIVEASFSITDDSVFLSTLGEQRMAFATVQKYLSLDCVVENNLARVKNLKGDMVFRTTLAESSKMLGKGFLLNAKQVGYVNVKGMGFDFIGDKSIVAFDLMAGKFSFDEDSLHIDKFSGVYDQSDFTVQRAIIRNIPEFILYGEPLDIDSIYLTSTNLKLTKLFTVATSCEELAFPCMAQESTAKTEISQIMCNACIDSHKPNEEPADTTFAYSILKFLQESNCSYAKLDVAQLSYQPSYGYKKMTFEDFTLFGQLQDGVLLFRNFYLNLRPGNFFQTKPMIIKINNPDSIGITGALQFNDIALSKVIEYANGTCTEGIFDKLGAEGLDMDGAASFDFDFSYVIGSDANKKTDAYIKNFQVIDGVTKNLNTIQIGDVWKNSVSFFKRLAANIYLGNVAKRIDRPSQFVMNVDNIRLTNDNFTFEKLEFNSDKVNIGAKGQHIMGSGTTMLEMVVQKPKNDYSYSEFESLMCDQSFMAYMKGGNAESTTLTLSDNSDYEDCLAQCPCDNTEDCEKTCADKHPKKAISSSKQKIKIKLKSFGSKVLKSDCKSE